MEDATFLTALNSFLLSVVSAAFVMISFFLKDLYQDFKKQMEKTNSMHAELHVHVKLFQELTRMYQQQTEELKRRITRLEQESRFICEEKKKSL